ncbi:MAG: Crp/Fnr family transcriptional regulator [Clostridiales bacterium]|nr:Crp/Fnr family transcriptional regulator [Clostridiales bacterium]
MMNYIEILKRSDLFKNVSGETIEGILEETGNRVKSYDEGSVVIKTDSGFKDIGIVLNGNVCIKGIGDYTPGRTFGIKLAAAKVVNPFEIYAAEVSEIMFINYGKLIKCAGKNFQGFYRVVENITELISQENLSLNERISVLSQNGLRNKLLEFFRIQKVIHGDNVLSLNMSRLEIADYLCVDRCSLSRELTKLRKEGLIEIDKQKITLMH